MKSLVLVLLLYPIMNILQEIFLFSFPFHLIEERKKFDLLLDTRKYSDFLENLNKLKKGKVLLTTQGIALNYTNANILYSFDKNFLDIVLEDKDLKDIGYVVLPSDSDPIMYSPILNRSLYNSAKSKIIFDSNDWKIFKIESSPLPHLYDSIELKIVSEGKNKKIYTSTQDGRPYLFMPFKSNQESLSVLKPGLYDFICVMDVNVDRDTHLSLRLEPYFGGGGNQNFYLKKGQNKVYTRFLHTHIPFRLSFTSSNPNVLFSNVKLSYALQEELLSPKNVLFYDKNGMPLTIDNQGKAILKPEKHEVLFFDKPFQAKEVLSLKVNGFGIIKFAISSPSYMKHVRKLMRYQSGRWLLSKLPLKFYEYTLNGKEESLHIPFEEEGCIVAYVGPGMGSMAQEVVLKDLAINDLNKNSLDPSSGI